MEEFAENLKLGNYSQDSAPYDSVLTTVCRRIIPPLFQTPKRKNMLMEITHKYHNVIQSKMIDKQECLENCLWRFVKMLLFEVFIVKFIAPKLMALIMDKDVREDAYQAGTEAVQTVSSADHAEMEATAKNVAANIWGKANSGAAAAGGAAVAGAAAFGADAINDAEGHADAAKEKAEAFGTEAAEAAKDITNEAGEQGGADWVSKDQTDHGKNPCTNDSCNDEFDDGCTQNHGCPCQAEKLGPNFIYPMAAPGDIAQEDAKIVTVPSKSQIALEYWIPGVMMVVADLKINQHIKKRYNDNGGDLDENSFDYILIGATNAILYWLTSRSCTQEKEKVLAEAGIKEDLREKEDDRTKLMNKLKP